MLDIWLEQTDRPVTDAELRGVFDRGWELYRELQKEYASTSELSEPTERIKNLFHEVLLKVRSAFDMTMVRVWDKYGRPHWLKDEPNISFPISDTEAKFEKAMRLFKVPLQSLNSGAYEQIRRIQPFVLRDQPHWKQLRDLTNLGKHVRLPRHSREFKAAKRFVGLDGTVAVWMGGVTIQAETYGGVPINPATGLPESGVEDYVECVTTVSDGGHEVQLPGLFCSTSLMYGERIVAGLLASLKP